MIELVDELPKNKKSQRPSEEAVAELVTGLCDPDSEVGAWVKHLDIVEGGATGLDVVKHPQMGQCRGECRTVASSCEELMDSVDSDDVQVKLWKGSTKSAITQKLCNEWSTACKKKKLGPVADREDEDFVDLDGNTHYAAAGSDTTQTGSDPSFLSQVMAKIPKAWMPKELSKYVSSTVGEAYKEASKYVTYKKMGKEATKMKKWYLDMWNAATWKGMSKKYHSTKKEGTKLYTKVHKTATTVHKTKADNSGMSFAAFVLLVLLAMEGLLAVCHMIFCKFAPEDGEDADDTLGLLIFAVCSLVIGVYIVNVTVMK